MNPKIEKLRGELDKNKNRELDKQIRELENTDIIGMVRERGLTPEELMEFLLGASANNIKKERHMIRKSF